MALPSPNLDDRRFQQLVDEAKRYVQQRAPEWTDHNVSDPGVTLIETFAYMVDQLLYRLNRVPEKNYSAFLDLLGIRLFPPAAATAEVDFWLSAPQPETVTLRAGAEVATARSETEEGVVFATTEELPIVPCELTRLVTAPVGGEQVDRTTMLAEGRDIRCFQAAPAPGDAMLFGLPAAVPRCIVSVNLDSRVEGVGVDPRQPPLAWEAWDGARWLPCETGSDTTGGLNRPGEVIVYVPAGHTASVVAGTRGGWLRCRVTEPEPGPAVLLGVADGPRGGGVHRRRHRTRGTRGDCHRCASRDVRGGRGPAVRRDSAARSSSTGSRPSSRCPRTRAGRGGGPWSTSATPRRRPSCGDRRDLGHVHVPTRRTRARRIAAHVRRGAGEGRAVRVLRYRTGGGAGGNVARGAISVLRSSVPYIARVENREAARGGVDGESVDNAKLRAPDALRMQERAVTAEDYEIVGAAGGALGAAGALRARRGHRARRGTGPGGARRGRRRGRRPASLRATDPLRPGAGDHRERASTNDA